MLGRIRRLDAAASRDAAIILAIYAYIIVRLCIPAWLFSFIHVPCLFAFWTGRPCLGCGLPGSVVLLLKGQFAESLRLNPIAPIFIGALILATHSSIKTLREGA